MFKKTIVLFLMVTFSVICLPAQSKALAVNETTNAANTTTSVAALSLQPRRWRNRRWRNRWDNRWNRRSRRMERRRDRREDRRDRRRDRREDRRDRREDRRDRRN